MIHASASHVGVACIDVAAGEVCEERRNLEFPGRLSQAEHGSLPIKESAHAECEQEFVRAIEAYKVSSGRMFPTWSEVLEVLIDLGYVKVERCAEKAS